jgi:BASS family bile acid:Na+ symporter
VIGRILASALGPRFWVTGYVFLILGLVLPGEWSGLKPTVPLLLGGILFFSFLRLPFAEVVGVVGDRRRWAAACWLAVLKLLAIPGAVWLLMRGISPEWAAGMLLVACMPAGLTSIALTDLQRGDRAQALLLVVLTSFLAPVSVPMLLTLLTGASPDPGAVAGRALYILALLVVPFVAAQAMRALFPGPVARHQAQWSRGSIACAMLLVGASVLAVRGAWAGTPALSLLWPLLLTIIASLVAVAAIWLVARRSSRAETVAFACGAIYVNNGLAVAFAVQFYPGDAHMVLPAILIQVPMLALIALLPGRT